ncbi:hypothetical protein [Roseateles saccharophilus]|uniref:Uncharacterized protein n=1 Tax=Roseateles saccharophilus TaxID=304 RepID=A0A4R3USM9_ROSSA|nr:hypothetical protein [Roseateles saccharophilus]MDG0833339.1 hypothetical protein [Roseateles saccharophilus]TCU93790.1 hypothetical protein EV671_101849 [Roseateles saccharophilus]
MRRLMRLLAGTAGVLVTLLLLSPWLLYAAMLASIEGRPAKPERMVPATEQARIWRLADGQGELRTEPMTPYGFAWELFAPTGQPAPGETLAYWVSRDFLQAQPHRNMLTWHLSNAALTIWLTRNWTAEELASAVAPIASKWPSPKTDSASVVPPAQL